MKRKRASDVVARPAREYDPPDPTLRAYDHGLGTLRVDGELVGYLASVVGEIRFPVRAPWPWFVIVWTDGRKEFPFEDYGRGWWTVRELDAGYLEHYGPSEHRPSRFLWMKTVRIRRGEPRTYAFEWLPPGAAAEKWQELGLADSDF